MTTDRTSGPGAAQPRSWDAVLAADRPLPPSSGCSRAWWVVYDAPDQARQALEQADAAEVAATAQQAVD